MAPDVRSETQEGMANEDLSKHRVSKQTLTCKITIIHWERSEYGEPG